VPRAGPAILILIVTFQPMRVHSHIARCAVLCYHEMIATIVSVVCRACFVVIPFQILLSTADFLWFVHQHSIIAQHSTAPTHRQAAWPSG
jgi:hypothetical protein